MAYRGIEQLLSDWYARGCNGPTRTKHFHRSTNNSLLGTISSYSLERKGKYVQFSSWTTRRKLQMTVIITQLVFGSSSDNVK